MERLKELREAKKLSQVKLGIMLSVAQETISGYEIGRAQPSVDMLVKLADVLGASVDYILERTDVKTVIKTAELSEQETELLTLFRGLSDAKRERALGMLTALED
ncbi:MAG: XRE family transcriptional regulator [Clostridia bacterium]|uniref:helix-turn-helix domain-containing protein n=1 Tax=Pygmaiobacter massiliensis TaxID=1917873 RepID=UPI001EC8ECC4|nr:helix-turn-helix transcriptional regulator [Pygmaiobacter massiliensis]MDD3230732.1 helix-turn-helix transcriptional regulator [Oscillospiraceae bacterium]NCC07725.1 XRE family transcriptional regulator [Clostridia bacterium]